MTERRGYPSDLKDDQWELIEPMLLKWRASRGEGREPVASLREVVNAVLYVVRLQRQAIDTLDNALSAQDDEP
ncbi:transposase [Streptomyces sp. NPDC085929]|uniref:transposase n=1 Tax=Streptomyces sp. NPDC085929 TaxID=3365739 RepID=UPI0037D76917